MSEVDIVSSDEYPLPQTITVADHGEEPPLSLAQERVWFFDLMAPSAPFHNVPRLIAIDGPLRPALLERAMNRIVERHAVLRCTYHTRDGALIQRIGRPRRIEVPVTDLRTLPEPDRELTFERLAADLVSRPFDIAVGPLMRGHLIQLDDERYVFVLDFHHIACDGWSERNALNEIGILYDAYQAGKPDPLPPLPMQYFDYAAWQRHRLSSQAMARHHDYWRAKLGEAIPSIVLPTDRAAPHRRTYEGANLGFELAPEVATGLRELARAENATLFMLMLSVFYILLHRYSGQHDIVIGSPINNRERDDLHDLIGYFVTRLPLRVDISGDPSVRGLLGRVRRTVLEAFEHKETTAERWPYPRTDEAVRDSSNYRVMFFFQENPIGVERRFGGLRVTNANVRSDSRIANMGLRSPTLGSQLDLGLFIEPVGDRVFGWIEYSVELFDRATIVRLRQHLLSLLAGATGAPDSPISRIPMLSDRERAELVPRLPGRALAAADRELVLPQLFAEQVARTPTAIAVEDDLESLTYNEVLSRADALAGELLARGVGGGTPVAILLRRSIELLVSVLGVLRAGGVVVPLDEAEPDIRLTRMLRQAGCSFAVASSVATSRVHALGLTAVPARFGDAPAPVLARQRSEDPAFLFATSGSTGEPRLVEIAHRGASVAQLPDLSPYPLIPDDALLFTAPPGSVRLIGECFWPWLAGCRVVTAPDGPLSPEELADQVIRHDITVLSLIPSVLRQVLDSPMVGEFTQLRILQVLGEPLPTWLVRRASQVLPNTRLVNSYAQTESCPALFHTCGARSDGLFAAVDRRSTVAIGYVLDQHREPVPYNVVGDVYIGGLTVASGYRGSRVAVDSPFVADPFSGTGGRMFRTGDRGRVSDDGALEVIGRTDNRVKVHGHTVALEEVEAALHEDPEIVEAMVRCHPTSGGDAQLVAYVVATGPMPVSSQRVRAQAAVRLPRHMVPAQIVVVKSLPRNANGKVDRAADMPVPDFTATGQPAPPRTDTERRIAEVWTRVLGVPSVGIYDGFFELGGTSLAGIRLMSYLGRAFGVQLNVRMLVEERTVAGLAERIEEILAAPAGSDGKEPSE